MVYKEIVKTIEGRENSDIELRAVPFMIDYKIEADVWGIVGEEMIRIRKDPDKSIKKYGSVENYKNSKDRGLFYYITIGQYFGFYDAQENILNYKDLMDLS